MHDLTILGVQIIRAKLMLRSGAKTTGNNNPRTHTKGGVQSADQRWRCEERERWVIIIF